MIDYGARNLNIHCKTVNQLNVFPVPDGDTGTNMVTTIKKGLLSLGKTDESLADISKKFAHSIVFEARGNSGVIVSQFLKGLSEKFFDCEKADTERLIEAFEHGVKCAYSAVINPVDGTMLTVLKDATNAAKKDLGEDKTVNDIMNVFLKEARASLDRTPELLPILKESGVVDSGGAGVVYFFEGIKKYLDGEVIEESATEPESEKTQADYSSFNKASVFDYGYCTELLIQLLDSKEDFIYDDFKANLQNLGDSVVTSYDNDKIRIHIHTKTPEEILSFCHRYGEFLSIKIDNMTVQHTEVLKNILCSPNKNNGAFSVVAVAYDSIVQELFIDMGADVVIRCEDSVPIKDYIDAFENVTTENIIVFPNGSDSILSAIQAKKIYKKANITVVNSRGIAECYASLPTIDFAETDIDLVADEITKTINNLYIVSVVQRKNPVYYKSENIQKNSFYSFSGKEIIVIGKTLEETIVKTIDKTFEKFDKDIITIFHGKDIVQESVDVIVDAISELGISAEVFTVQTENLASDMILSFE